LQFRCSVGRFRSLDGVEVSFQYERDGLRGVVAACLVQGQLSPQHWLGSFAQHELEGLATVVSANQPEFGVKVAADLADARLHRGAGFLERGTQSIGSAGRQVERVKATQPQHSRAAYADVRRTNSPFALTPCDRLSQEHRVGAGADVGYSDGERWVLFDTLAVEALREPVPVRC
jgi:hypothetical protein